MMTIRAMSSTPRQHSENKRNSLGRMDQWKTTRDTTSSSSAMQDAIIQNAMSTFVLPIRDHIIHAICPGKRMAGGGIWPRPSDCVRFLSRYVSVVLCNRIETVKNGRIPPPFPPR